MKPSDHEELYRAIELGGVRSPGRVKLSGHERKQDWEIKAAKGQDGASSSLNGAPLGGFTALFELSDDPLSDVDEFAEWDAFQALIESTTKGKVPLALPVYHPDLARNGYTAVVNGGVGGMNHDGKGGATVEVKFQEHRPPKKKPVGKAKSSSTGKTSAGGVGGKKVDPNAAAKAELEALVKEASAP